MTRFDPHLPHAEVIGVPGVTWDQNGQLFRRDGCPMRIVDGVGEPIDVDATVQPDGIPVVVDADASVLPKRRGRPPRSLLDRAAVSPTFADRSDDELRGLMAVYGHEWTGRDAALQLLENATA